jgi:isopenicillin N synthase-like dioxygenase
MPLWRFYRDVLHVFTAKCTRLKDRLLPEMAKLLELDDDYFGNQQFGDKADTYARFSYYPPCPRPDLVFGLKPHSDGSFVSLLMVDSSVGGLQVLRDGVWYDVPTRPHTLLINLGDQMEVMGNRSP